VPSAACARSWPASRAARARRDRRRGGARPARRARATGDRGRAQSLGARALAEGGLDTALLLARQGVALHDSTRTRSNLLAALLKSPAAVGAIHGRGPDHLARARPDGRTLAYTDDEGWLRFVDVAHAPCRRAGRIRAGPATRSSGRCPALQRGWRARRRRARGSWTPTPGVASPRC
jgi:hypothetical protein